MEFNFSESRFHIFNKCYLNHGNVLILLISKAMEIMNQSNMNKNKA